MINQEINRIIAPVSNKRRCCFIDRITKLQCGGTAVWEIWPIGGDPYDFTDSCDTHLNKLLTDARIHEIHRIDSSVPPEESDE